MTDIVFYGKSYQAFLSEAVIKSPELVKNNNGVYKILYTSTQVVTNTRGEFMILVRAGEEQIGQFARCKSISNLGAYTSVFASPEKRKIYDRVYPNSPYDIIDREGNKITVTPPERFGAFE